MYWLTGLLGFVAIIAPLLLGYSSDARAFWTSLSIGTVLIVMALMEGLAEDKDRWEYWVAAGAGMTAILAPFVLGFSGLSAALWTLVVVGLVTVIVAGTKLYQRRTQYR